ncbi:hypothetical protein ACFQJ7_10645 [Halovenus rubra]|uniref:Uncharacterized protein n=2 Tax=Halovenus rubra TaxID=869890 RepID=A0ACC7DWF6_9EURY|nr:hypothetical protein [Halovenus rubra]
MICLLGLDSQYNGIDERRFTFEEYPSRMNYNASPDVLRFAGNEGHPDAPNDWKIIGEHESTFIYPEDSGGK